MADLVRGSSDRSPTPDPSNRPTARLPAMLWSAARANGALAGAGLRRAASRPSGRFGSEVLRRSLMSGAPAYQVRSIRRALDADTPRGGVRSAERPYRHV